MSKLYKNKKGLTIIEVLVAIGIVSVVLGATIILIIRVSQYGSSAETRSLAVNYAQEAIDIVKNVRDNEYCIFFSDYEDGNYRIDKIEPGAEGFLLTKIPNNTWVDLFENDPKADLATHMRRSIKLDEIEGEEEDEAKRITVEIQWQEKGSSSWDSYIAITDVYKWKY